MTHDASASFLGDIDLASTRLGGSVLWANDDFFAEKENLLKPGRAVFLEHEYTDRGKWMDGWESRRRRVPGHDECIVRLGLSGVVTGFVVDTSFFRGNYPDECSIEGCLVRSDADLATLQSSATEWLEILPRTKLKGDSQNVFAIDDARAFSHVRLHIYPDGGVARLRVHGRVVPDWRSLGGTGGPIDLAAVESGAEVLTCSDMFFGPKHNLIMPGRAANMGDGWETKRRRGPGHDWVLVALAGAGEVSRIEVDTNHFKGNFPDTCSIEACDAEGATDSQLLGGEVQWRELLPRTKLQASTRHFFVEELARAAVGEITHLRVNVFPDGGISRLRVHGTLSRRGRLAQGIVKLNAASKARAAEAFTTCCGSSTWVKAMLAALPAKSAEALFAASDAAAAKLTTDDWLEAFAHHPRIGESASARKQSADAKALSSSEQSGVATASDATLTALAEANRAYDAKFGFIFIVCASGKSAAEMLDLVRARLGNDRDTELTTAAVEQQKITRLRLERALLP